MALYMGSGSGFGFGNKPIWGGQPLPVPGGPFSGSGPVSAPSATATAPITPPPNVLTPNAVRATGPTQGFDASYLQNLASSIGNLFARPQGNLNFNPLGNLSDISSASSIGGNAPTPGLPLTMLQNALNGLGFSYTPPTSTTPTVPNVRNDQEPFRMMQGLYGY